MDVDPDMQPEEDEEVSTCNADATIASQNYESGIDCDVSSDDDMMPPDVETRQSAMSTLGAPAMHTAPL